MLFADKKTLKQFVNFAVVGSISTAVNYGIFFLLLHFGHIFYLYASAAGFITGIFISYSLNRKFTFTPSMGRQSHEFLLYVLVCLISLGLSLGALRLQVKTFSINPLLANLVAIGISTMSNFIGAKLLVFKQSGEQNKL